MNRHAPGILVVIAACASPRAAAPAPSSPPSSSTSSPAAIVAACASPEHRQLDFWIGDWDLVVRTRTSRDGPWTEARGSQHVEAILGGCAIAETFVADGPPQPWAGRSYSAWQPALGRWRQTWVDDSGGYLAFTGGVEAGVMTLVGEPQPQADGKVVLMRMVFLDVAVDRLRWEWQRQTVDGGWQPQMVIEYRRRAGAAQLGPTSGSSSSPLRSSSSSLSSGVGTERATSWLPWWWTITHRPSSRTKTLVATTRSLPTCSSHSTEATSPSMSTRAAPQRIAGAPLDRIARQLAIT